MSEIGIGGSGTKGGWLDWVMVAAMGGDSNPGMRGKTKMMKRMAGIRITSMGGGRFDISREEGEWLRFATVVGRMAMVMDKEERREKGG